MTAAKKLALAQRLFFLYFTKHGLPQTPRHRATGIKFSGVKIEIFKVNLIQSARFRAENAGVIHCSTAF